MTTKIGQFFLKKTLIFLGVFSLFQELIVQKLGPGELGVIVKQLDEAIILFLFAIVFTGKLLTLKFKGPTVRSLLIAGVIFSGFLSNLINSTPMRIAAEGCFMVAKGFMLYYVVSSVSFSKEEIKKIMKLFFVLGVIFFIGLVFDFCAPVAFRSFIGNTAPPKTRLGLVSPVSFFINPARTGWWMAYLCLFSFAAYMTYKRKIFLLAMTTFAIGTVLTLRAKPIFGSFLAISVGYVSIAGARHKRKWPIVALGFTFFLLAFFLEPITGLFQEKQERDLLGEYTPRTMLYKTAFDIANRHCPLGVGLGRYGGFIALKYYSPLYYEYGFDKKWGPPEKNPKFLEDAFWPMIIGETGYLGTIGYALILSSFLAMIRKKMKQGYHDPCCSLLCIAGAIILLESIAESVAMPFFTTTPFIFFFFGLMGLINGSVSHEKYDSSISLPQAAPSAGFLSPNENPKY